MDILVPQIVLEQVAEVIRVIPQEPGSERIVEQTIDVPTTMERMTLGVPQTQRLRRVVHVAVGISQERVQQRTVELEHQSQLTPALIQKVLECETNEESERSAALSRTKADSDSAKRERGL